MVTVASVTKTVSVGARDHVRLTAQGAYIKLCGGNIELHGPGKVEFKATMKELAGPRSSVLATPSLPKAVPMPSTDKQVFSQQFDLSHIALNDQLAFSSRSLPYKVYEKSGRLLAQGTTDENGVTDRVFTNEPTELVLLVGEGEWQVEEYFESDDMEDTPFDDRGVP
jgi:type VI secretion system secreted protein VgrG